MMAVMSLSRKNLRKIWMFEFIGEGGIDTGEEVIFIPDNGLWQYRQVIQMSMDINLASELAHPENHLEYFRNCGTTLGLGSL